MARTSGLKLSSLRRVLSVLGGADSHRPDRSGAGREAGGVPVSGVVARDGSVRARGKTGARARAPVVRCAPRRPAPVVASRARGPGTMAGTEGAGILAGWRNLRR